MFDRHLFDHFDWLLFAIMVCLVVTGVVTIYSATHSMSQHIYHKEIYLILFCTLVFLAVIVVNYSLLDRFAYLIFGASILLLVIALLYGRSIGGAQRWISLGFASFQPSEFSKLALIIALAKYFSSKRVSPKGLKFRELLPPLLILSVPFVLITRQPDLGTALVLFLIFSSMVLIVRVRTRVLFGILLSSIPMIPIAWGSLKDYQKERLLSFIDPSMDPLGSGYHILQSKIAIGSGGILGKGFTKGTQGKLMFLPEHHTDFIFSILAEEWGLVGSMIVILLFMALIFRGFDIARKSKDRFGFLLAFGISAMFFWHVVINLGMVSGLLPVVGIPLPFLSYGGSFLLTSFVAVALLVNIRMRMFIF